MAEDKNPIIRRVGSKDRKRKIETQGGLFSEESGSPFDDLEAATRAQEQESGLITLDDLEALIHETKPTTATSSIEKTEDPAPPSSAPILNDDDLNDDELNNDDQNDGQEDVGEGLKPSRLEPLPIQQPVFSEEDHAIIVTEAPAIIPARPQPLKAQPGRYPPLPGDIRPQKKAVLVQPPVLTKRRRGGMIHNLLALIFMLGTIGAAIYFVIIWNDPYSTLNPLAPATPFIEISQTPDVVAIANYHATQTAEAGATSVPIVPTPIPVSAVYPFTLSPSGVIYAPNGNGSGCDWSSIAGTVTGIANEPLNGYGVQITDAQDASRLSAKVFSGSALTFGEGGFEFSLGGTPQNGEFAVQLFSAAGAPVSDVFIVATRDTCEENVAVVNFVQIRDF